MVIATGEDTPTAFAIPTGSDQDSDTLSYYLSALPLTGSVVSCMNLTGSTGSADLDCQYTGGSNVNGGDNFSYYVNDGYDDSPSVAWVYVTINAVDDVPTFANATPTAYLNESGPATPTYLTTSFQGDEGGASDEDTQSLSISISSSDPAVIPPVNVTVSYNGTPIGASSGSTDFVSLSDSTDDADDKNITLSIYPVQYKSAAAAVVLTAKLNDGTNTTTKDFTIKVIPVDNPPWFLLVATPPSVLEGTPISIGPFLGDEGGGALAPTLADEDGRQRLSAIVQVTASPNAYVSGDYIVAGTPYASVAKVYVEPSGAAVDAAVHPFNITINPTSNPDANGKFTMSVGIYDGVTTTTQLLDIYVTPVNDAPLICDITFTGSPTSCTPVPSPAAVTEGTPIPTVEAVIDEGGSTFEDYQDMTFKVESLNTYAIPNSAISWTNGTVSAGGGTPMALGDSTNDSYLTPVCIMVTPNADINTSLSGPVGIKMLATDSDGTPTSSIFYVQVAADNDAPVITADADYTAGVEANEGGKIYNLGFTLDEGGEYDEDLQSLRITLSSSDTSLIPNANITTTYYDMSTTLTGNLTPVNWGDGSSNASASGKKLVLNLQPVAGLSGSASITLTVADSAGLTSTYVIPVTVDDISTLQTGWTDIKSEASATDALGNVIATPFVSLSWDPMIMSGSDILHYNIYRADGENLEDFDFANPIATTTDSTVTTFTDTSVADQTMYWYIVAPVDATSTPTYSLPIEDEDRIVRVVVPPTNMVLAHKWMINREACEKMGLTADRRDDYACPYFGPGDTSSSYYKHHRDLAIDRFEAGCNYADADSGQCSENLNQEGCISIGDPDTLGYSAIDGTLYYDRSSGTCYIASSTCGGSWCTMREMETTAGILTDGTVDWAEIPYNVGHLPPLNQISQHQAQAYCSNGTWTFTLANDPDGNSFTKRLPQRDEQVAAAAWPTAITNINDYEGGTDLPTSGYCNTNSADGLTYEETTMPSSDFPDALPGTLSSGIKLVRTDSMMTSNCVSRYGAQDLIGNVKEWGQERIDCALTTDNWDDPPANTTKVADICLADYRVDDTGSTDMGTWKINGSSDTVQYDFDGGDTDVAGNKVTGPCGILDPGCDGVLEVIGQLFSSDAGVNATYFNYPAGLPLAGTVDSTTTISNAVLGSAALTYSDTWTLQTSVITDHGGLLSGGDYDDIDGAGRYSLYFYPTSSGNVGTGAVPATAPDTSMGFRCFSEIKY